MIVAYGENLLATPPAPGADVYYERYKGIASSFTILRWALTGDYVNFGVFQLYGDAALDKALDMFFKMTLAVPLEDLNTYPKLAKAFYSLFFPIARDHTVYLAKLMPDVFE